MTGLDVAILVFTALMAAFGWRQGFLVGVLSLAGFAAGAYGGTRLAQALVSDDAGQGTYAPLLGLLGALVGGAILATGLEGLGLTLRGVLGRVPGLRSVDGLLGAVLSAALALGITWVAAAVALQTPTARSWRRDIQASEVLSRLNTALPPSGPLLNALEQFDPFPRLDGPAAEVAAPPPRIARDPQVEAAAASVVRIKGTACGLGVTGSGWVAAPGLVVTNAHVVAGQDDTTVQRRGTGPELDATPVAYDPRNDLAVLRVGGLDAPALRRASGAPERGTAGAILGFPLNGPYDVRAARLAQTQAVVSEDAYGRGPVTRRITAFRGLVRPGNSGGPVVDADGRVVSTVFAAAAKARSGRRTGYGIPDDVVAQVLDRVVPAGRSVSTGPCSAG